MVVSNASAHGMPRALVWEWLELLDNNLAGHFGMDGAEIVVGAWCREYVRELFVGVKRAGIKCPALDAAAGGVGNVGVVEPGHFAATRTCQLWWVESEG